MYMYMYKWLLCSSASGETGGGRTDGFEGGVPIGCCVRFVVMGVGTGAASVGGDDGDD